MKMTEFLATSDDDKVHMMPDGVNFRKVTEDLGACSQCGKRVDVGDFCFGCHKLVCLRCVEKEPHYSQCRCK